jgi:hypothetical protein
VCGDADHWGDNSRGQSVDRGKLRHALKIDIDDSMVNLLKDAISSHLAE